MDKNQEYPQAARALLSEALAADQHARLAVTGESMKPLIRRGDGVVVRRLDAMPPPLGTILVFEQGGEYVTHRLVAVEARGWLTKGDALSALDAPVDPANVLGWVAAVERCGTTRGLDSPAALRRGGWIAWLGRAQVPLASRWYAQQQARARFSAAWLAGFVGRLLAEGLRVAIIILS